MKIIRPYKVCNWTLQRKVFGFPKCLIKSAGFIRLTKLVPGFKFFKQRNDQMEFKINFNEYIKRDSNLRVGLVKPVSKIILSNCTDDSILIKIIGVKNDQKVYYGFKIVQEILGNIVNPITGIKLKYNLRASQITATNIVINWCIPQEILMNFEIIKINLGNICHYQPDKIPLMRIRFKNPNFVCTISQNGECMVPGLKSQKNVGLIQNMVEDTLLSLWDEESYNRFKNFKYNGSINVLMADKSSLENIGEEYLDEIEEAESDALHFMKGESCFYIINENGKKVRPEKFFNKAAVKNPKKKFVKRLNSLRNIDIKKIPHQEIGFYFNYNRLLRYECKPINS